LSLGQPLSQETALVSPFVCIGRLFLAVIGLDAAQLGILLENGGEWTPLATNSIPLLRPRRNLLDSSDQFIQSFTDDT
jgi:hypothetical protein